MENPLVRWLADEFCLKFEVDKAEFANGTKRKSAQLVRLATIHVARQLAISPMEISTVSGMPVARKVTKLFEAAQKKYGNGVFGFACIIKEVRERIPESFRVQYPKASQWRPHSTMVKTWDHQSTMV